ncbi:hypothetical protein NDU88_007992 [Pleurodeles waltl]|uniref:Uncharacterized protein n=1 Tax=Pleurodeles waltl TaxID=8319 RepID=A0AAV7VUG8_PLEWA|nr:hypothetical protein NDU88_007992 [Pleurodeles waltl]
MPLGADRAPGPAETGAWVSPERSRLAAGGGPAGDAGAVVLHELVLGLGPRDQDQSVEKMLQQRRQCAVPTDCVKESSGDRGPRPVDAGAARRQWRPENGGVRQRAEVGEAACFMKRGVWQSAVDKEGAHPQ